MAILQTKSGQNSTGTTLPIVWDSNTTTGSLIVVAITKFGTITSVTDSQSNTYTQVYATAINGSQNHYLYYAFNITGGTTPTVTINKGSTANVSAIIREYSGVLTSNPLDVSSSALGASGTTHSSPTSASTTQADELVIGTLGDDQGTATTIGLGSGFGNLTEQDSSSTNSVAIEDKTIAATGTQVASFTSGASSYTAVVGVATFKLAAAFTTSTSSTSSSTSSTSSSISTSTSSTSTSRSTSTSSTSTSQSTSTSSTSFSTSSTSTSVSITTSTSSTSSSTSFSTSTSSTSTSGSTSTSSTSTSQSTSTSSTSTSTSKSTSTSSTSSSTSLSTSTTLSITTSTSSTSSSTSSTTTLPPSPFSATIKQRRFR